MVLVLVRFPSLSAGKANFNLLFSKHAFISFSPIQFSLLMLFMYVAASSLVFCMYLNLVVVMIDVDLLG